MKHISSRENPSYKLMARLGRGRDAGQAVIEGIHLCQAWLQHSGPPRLALFDSDRLARHAELASLAAELDESLCMTCEPRLIHALSDVEHGQGVFFIVGIPQPEPPAAIERTCIWLDRVQDPGNLGTILRTAVAAGIRDAYLSAGCVQAWSQKVLRSAQGAHFAMAVHQQMDLRALRTRLAVPLVATTLGRAQSLYEAELPTQCAWLFGNEGQGVAPDLLDMADVRLFIPQDGGVESLNVGVAAAICLFEHRRRGLARPG